MPNLTDYIVLKLIENNVTNIFGISGGSVLDFIYSVNKRKDTVLLDTLFSEFSSVYAAIGSAQINYNLGVAFVSKGPGLTNALTPITDAYFDSIPLVVITGHSTLVEESNARINLDQDINVTNIFGPITKRIYIIDSEIDFELQINEAINTAISGRPGPVIIDLNNELTRNQSIQSDFSLKACSNYKSNYNFANTNILIDRLLDDLMLSSKPIFLVGNGLRISNSIDLFLRFVDNFSIPIVSSRTSQDLFPEYSGYIGYIGSRGTRAANILMDRSDMIIIIGNRAMYPKKSESYSKLLSDKVVYWIEYDVNELTRDVHGNIIKVNSKLDYFLLEVNNRLKKSFNTWLHQAKAIKEILINEDNGAPVNLMSEILRFENKDSIIVSDVGNNELWLSLAYQKASLKNRLIHSKSLSVMGSSLAKGIGVSIVHKKHVICCVGDQGLNSSLSDLAYIAEKRLNITILILNNMTSGMIKDRQKAFGYLEGLLVSKGNGYVCLNYEKICSSLNISYFKLSHDDFCMNKINQSYHGPKVIELLIPSDISLSPSLPGGNTLSNQLPLLDETIKIKIDEIMDL
jgi:acetolactate synthase I/II/III large subunit